MFNLASWTLWRSNNEYYLTQEYTIIKGCQMIDSLSHQKVEMCFYISDKRIFFQRNIQEERFIDRAIFSDPHCLLKFPFQAGLFIWVSRIWVEQNADWSVYVLRIWLKIEIGCLHRHYNDMSCWFITVKPWILIIPQWFYLIYILHIIC